MVKIIIYCASILFLLLSIIIMVIVTNKNKKLDKTAEVVRELLPNLDCGRCGRENCAKFGLGRHFWLFR